MPLSVADKRAVNKYTQELLRHPDLGPPLIARAQEAKPGRPVAGRARGKDPQDSASKGKLEHFDSTLRQAAQEKLLPSTSRMRHRAPQPLKRWNARSKHSLLEDSSEKQRHQCQQGTPLEAAPLLLISASR